MKNWKRYSIRGAAFLLLTCSLPSFVAAQGQADILLASELARVVPPGFYFILSAPPRFELRPRRVGENRHGRRLLDPSGI